MIESDSGQEKVFAIDPDAMEQAIGWWLTPVVDHLKQISGGDTQAHAEVAAAHDTQADGWFGGEGNNEVRWATSSFLNETEWQLRQLADEGAQLASSLEEYRDILLGHIKWARQMDKQNAERFRAIERDMTENRGW